MMTRRAVTAAVFGLSLLAALPAASAMDMHDAKAGTITISNAWARASAGMAKAGGGFLTLANGGAEGDRLIAAKADVSKVVELHTHIKDGEVMRMRPVEAIDVPAGETVSLQPGGLHVMFIDLNAPLTEGQHFPLTLVFEKSGEATIDVEVKAAGAMGMGPGGMGPGGMGMNHGPMNGTGMGKAPMKQ
jgi:copper(I)-binding protein